MSDYFVWSLCKAKIWDTVSKLDKVRSRYVMQIEEYCDKEGKYAENDQLVLKRLQENDKENYMNLKIDTSSIPKAYDNEAFFEETWKDSLKNKDLNLSLFSRDTNVYLGNLMLKNLSSDIQEVGIDIVREYRNKGIGHKAVELLLDHAKAVSGARKFEVKIYSDNTASKRLFEKFGSIELKREDSEFICVMKELEKMLGLEKMNLFREKNKEVFEQAKARCIILYEIQYYEEHRLP